MVNLLRRKIDRYLLDWKADENRLPLIVKGARQIGKTESVRAFAYANYRNVIETSNPQLIPTMSSFRDARPLVTEIADK